MQSQHSSMTLSSSFPCPRSLGEEMPSFFLLLPRNSKKKMVYYIKALGMPRNPGPGDKILANKQPVSLTSQFS